MNNQSHGGRASPKLRLRISLSGEMIRQIIHKSAHFGGQVPVVGIHGIDAILYGFILLQQDL
jgi:hypothetical protein